MSDTAREINAWLRIVVLGLTLAVTVTAAWFRLEERITLIEAQHEQMLKQLDAIENRLSHVRTR